MNLFCCINLFSPKVNIDNQKCLFKFYENDILFMYSDKYNKYNKYKLTNVVKINEINYKLFFADEYKHVIIVSFTKKTTYFLFEVTHLSDFYNKFLIVNESCSKNLHTFFFKLRHHFNDNIDSRVVDEFILFLDLDSI